jgi:type VI secretion system protein ImpL
MKKLYVIGGLVVAAVAALVAIWRAVIKKRKAAAAAKEAEASTASESPEIDLAFHEAEARLAAAKLNSGTRVADLPVFLLLGDPGAAKTTIMVHSGLDPELLSGQVFQNSDITPTAGINLWFARQAVFVEAGGKLLLQPGNWDRLLRRLVQRGLLLRNREPAPRAVLVVHDCANLMGPDARESAITAARSLRARLGEVSQVLGIDLPVYVLFTKMDRLPYFSDFVTNFSNDEANQTFGATLSVLSDRRKGIYAEAETTRLTECFNRVFRSLAEGRIEFLSRQADPVKLPGTYEFPREFRKIRSAAVQFLLDLCRPSQLTVGPYLRGFYFSGTRSVVAADNMPARSVTPLMELETVSGATQIFRREDLAQVRSAAAVEPALSVVRRIPQWMFLSRLFHDVVLGDCAVLGARSTSIRTNAARRYLLGAVAAICVVAALILTISFFGNRRLEARVLESAAAVSSEESTARDLAPATALRKLEELRQSLDELTNYRRAGAPWHDRWGLYAGDELYPETRRMYFLRFRQFLFGRAQSAILEDLRTLPAVPGPEYAPTYEFLKAYLITTSNHDKSTPAFLRPVLMKSWSAGAPIDSERRSLAELQFDFYAGELKEANPFSEETDPAAVEKARRYLAQFAGVERVYALVASEAAKNGSPVNFNRQFPGSAAVVTEPHEVGAAFSKGGWKFMEDALRHPDRYFNGEKWVLGDQGAPLIDSGRLENDLRARYYSDFLREWRTYLQSAGVVPYTDIKDAAAKLRILSGNQSPLLALLSVASQHTAAADPAVSAVFQPAQAVVPPALTDRYISEPNQNYVNALSTLQVALESISGQPDDPAVAQALNDAVQAKIVARRMAQGFRLDSEGRVDAAVQKLLEDPILFVEQTLRGAVPAELNAGGKTLCTQFRALTGKFPFNLKSKTDATVADLNAVMRKPDGAFWTFYEKGLKKALTKQGAQYAASGATPLNPAFVTFFNTAAALSDALYPQGAADPSFTFTITPGISDAVQGITLRIDGQTLSYSLGTQAQDKKFTWHAAEPHDLAANVRVGGADFEWQHQPGTWGIFRFLAEAKHWNGHTVEWPVGAGAQQFKWDGKPVTLRLVIDMEPLETAVRNGLTCVAEVAQ